MTLEDMISHLNSANNLARTAEKAACYTERKLKEQGHHLYEISEGEDLHMYDCLVEVRKQIKPVLEYLASRQPKEELTFSNFLLAEFLADNAPKTESAP